jgi:hypothetical protein
MKSIDTTQEHATQDMHVTPFRAPASITHADAAKQD